MAKNYDAYYFLLRRRGVCGCKVCALTESKILLKRSNAMAVSYPALCGICNEPICESINPSKR